MTSKRRCARQRRPSPGIITTVAPGLEDEAVPAGQPPQDPLATDQVHHTACPFDEAVALVQRRTG